MANTKKASFLVLTVLVGLVGGCAADKPDTSDEAVSVAPSEVFTRTIVYLGENGSQDVYFEQVTLAEQLAARAEKTPTVPGASGEEVGSTSLPITHDTSCLGSSVQLWDQTNFTGNQICFYGDGHADLASYTWICAAGVCLPWWGAVRSLKTNSYEMQMSETGSTCDCERSFCGKCTARGQNTNVSTASACEQDARWVSIPLVCERPE